MRRRMWRAVGMAVVVMAVQSARGQEGAEPPGWPGEMKVGGDAQDVRAIETVGAALHASGQDDAAVDLALRWSTRDNDPSSLSVLGDIALDKGDAAAAVVWYQRAAMFRRTDAGLMYRTAAAMSRVPGMRGVAKDLRAYVPLLVLGDRAMAQRVRGYMEKYEGAAAADDWFDDFTRRFGPDDPAAMAQRLDHARQHAQAAGDWDAALATAMQQRLVDAPMDPDAVVRAMRVMADYWRVRAMVALNKKNWGETEKALTRMMDYAAPDVGVLEDVMPALNAADVAAARRVLAAARGRLEAVVAEYPQAARYVEELKRVAALEK